MPQRRCTACGAVGGSREVQVQVERAGMMERYFGVWCITCVVGLTTWLEQHSLGRQDPLPLVHSTAATRRARSRATLWAVKNGLELPNS